MKQEVKYIVLRDEEGYIVNMWTSRAAAAEALGVSRQTIANHIPSDTIRNPKRSNKFAGHLSEELIEVEVQGEGYKFHNLEGEEWQVIPDYEEYEVSNCGRVRHGLHVMKATPCTSGYSHLGLTKDGETKMFYVHRLVASAFIPNPENKPQVNHIDENKSNNHYTNLEWTTAKENANHGTRNERISEAFKGQKARNVAKLVRCVETGVIYDSIAAAARAVGATYSTSISACCRGKLQTAHKLHWEFVDNSDR